MSVAPGFKEWASRRAPNPAGPGMGWARGVWELAKDAYGAGFRYHQADLLAKAERCEAAEAAALESLEAEAAMVSVVLDATGVSCPAVRASAKSRLSEMRAKAERCREAEGEVAAQSVMLNSQYLEVQDSIHKAEAWEAETLRLRARIADLESQRAAAWGAHDVQKLHAVDAQDRIAELEAERDKARQAAEHYRDGYDDAGPELKVLASNRFPWETSHD